MRKLAVLMVAGTFALLGFTAALAGEVTGVVVGITDGDTIKLLDQDRREHVIRISAIDAPERSQPYGQRAKQRLSALAFRRQATARCAKIDRYRRQVCSVFIANEDVGLRLVKDGMAWHFKRFQNEQSADDARLYTVAEREARARANGLWRDARPIAPWDWRSGVR